MVKTLIIGDLHFNDKPRGLLDAQISFTKRILSEGYEKGCRKVVFLGDLMMHRKPSPSVLLALKDVIQQASTLFPAVTILRGNHDSETKADDGVTALSLFAGPKVCVTRHTQNDVFAAHTYIPHYEDESRILEDLKQVPEGFTVFGHFGYDGALNSAGDSDFTLAKSDFTHRTILGHIHGYKQDGNITLLGTPFTTSFQECNKENFYATLDEKGLEVHRIEFGIRHLQMDYDAVEENLDWINDKDYYTLLRINMSSISEDQEAISSIIDKLDIAYCEVKYKPLVDTKEEFVVAEDKEAVLDISDAIIEDYINSSKSELGKEQLLEGLSLIYENQQSRD